MAFVTRLISGNQAGQVVDYQQVSVLSETDLAAASSTNLYGLLGYAPTAQSAKKLPALISLVCNASVAGSVTFDSDVAQYDLTLPLVQGLNIYKAENSPLWFFGDSLVLNLNVTTSTLTDIQLVMGLL